MYKKTSVLVLFLFLSLPETASITASANVTEAICGPHSHVDPTEYCHFFTFIKAGKDDAIISLSWDDLGLGMDGVPTPSMVGDYYFYFKDGKLYYLGSTLGAEELFYTFHNCLWYLSDWRAINPKGPCILKNVTPPEKIKKKLCSCGENISIKSPAYPVRVNGSRLYVSNGNVSYVIEVPDNVTIPISKNVSLWATFLGKGVLIANDLNSLGPFDWNNVTLLYYDGNSLYQLNLTEALRNRLPVCEGTASTCNGRSSPYWILPVAIILTLVLGLAYYGRIKRRDRDL